MVLTASGIAKRAGLLGMCFAGCAMPLPVGREPRADGGVSDARRVGQRTPSGELCDNGVDDDGNGRIDEGCPCLGGESQACYRGGLASRGVGTCRDGLQRCTGVSAGELGTWGPCEGGLLPVAEQCDGLDHNCNGAPNDGLTCVCQPGQTQTCGAASGSTPRAPCQGGVMTCGVNARWGNCEGSVSPQPDTCGDRVDNDCNGTVDDGCMGPDGGTPPIDASPLPPDAVTARPDVPASMPDAVDSDAGTPPPPTCNGTRGVGAVAISAEADLWAGAVYIARNPGTGELMAAQLYQSSGATTPGYRYFRLAPSGARIGTSAAQDAPANEAWNASGIVWDGTQYIIFYDRRQVVADMAVHPVAMAQRVSAVGALVGSPVPIARDPSSETSGATAIATGTGQIWLVWFECAAGATKSPGTAGCWSGHALARRYDSSLTPVGPVVEITAPAPDLAPMPNYMTSLDWDGSTLAVSYPQARDVAMGTPGSTPPNQEQVVAFVRADRAVRSESWSTSIARFVLSWTGVRAGFGRFLVCNRAFDVRQTSCRLFDPNGMLLGAPFGVGPSASLTELDVARVGCHFAVVAYETDRAVVRPRWTAHATLVTAAGFVDTDMAMDLAGRSVNATASIAQISDQEAVVLVSTSAATALDGPRATLLGPIFER